jgi:hypothetical protein
MVWCGASSLHAEETGSSPQDRAIWLVDDFEDGYLWDTWTQVGGSTCNPFIVQPAGWACAEGARCLEIHGDCGGFYDGIWTDLGGFQATSFSLSVRSTDITHANTYVVLDDDTSTADGTTVFFFGNGLGRWLVSSGGVPYDCGPRNLYQWYEVRFNLNWQARTVDVYIDQQLKASGVPMTDPTADGLHLLHLFNYEEGAGYYDFILASSPPPQPPIFVDGFESGDTSAWSLTVP